MTQFVRTGRILKWFLADIKELRARGVQFRVLPGIDSPFRPGGVYAFTPCRLGEPSLWCFPQPLHPIEAIASMRGFGPTAGARTEGRMDAMMELAAYRACTLVTYTNVLAEYLFVSPATVRFFWFLLTPTAIPHEAIPGAEEGMVEEAEALWAACGFPNHWWITHTKAAAATKYVRPQFWSHEVTGRIEV